MKMITPSTAAGHLPAQPGTPPPSTSAATIGYLTFTDFGSDILSE